VRDPEITVKQVAHRLGVAPANFYRYIPGEHAQSIRKYQRLDGEQPLIGVAAFNRSRTSMILGVFVSLFSYRAVSLILQKFHKSLDIVKQKYKE
jgi:hypothetical protein